MSLEDAEPKRLCRDGCCNISYDKQTTSEEPRYGDEIKKAFTPDITRNLHRLWKIIHNESYSTVREEAALLFEVMHYNEALRDVVANSVGRLSCLQAKDEDSAFRNITLPHSLSKLYSMEIRALVWQVGIELANEVTDIIFLTELIELDYTLFLVSLFFLICAFLARVLSGIYFVELVADRRLFAFGFLLSIIETNSGLYIIKRSLSDSDPNGISRSWKQSTDHKDSRDEVSVMARNEYTAGWAEVKYIFSVTIIQDLPELAIQTLFFIQQPNEDVGVVFYFALVTTLIHLILQWVEMIITFVSLRYKLPKIKGGREKTFDVSSADEKITCCGGLRSRDLPRAQVEPRSILQCCRKKKRKGYAKEVLDFAEKYQMITRRVAFKLHDDMSFDLFDMFSRQCTNLIELEFHGLDDVVNAEFARVVSVNCKQLVKIGLSSCGLINDEAVGYLVTCPWLTSINLAHTNVTDICTEHLQSLRTLTEVSFFETKVTDKGIKNIADTHQGLHNINMNMKNRHRPSRITNASLEALVNCKGLLILSANRQVSIDDGGLFAISACTKLRKVELHGVAVGDDGVIALVSSCVGLRWLNLNRTKIGDDSLIAVADSCKGLERLKIEECKGVGDNGVVPVLEQCLKLISLDVGFTGVGAGTGEAILEARKAGILMRVYLPHCKNIDQEMGRRIEAAFPINKEKTTFAAVDERRPTVLENFMYFDR